MVLWCCVGLLVCWFVDGGGGGLLMVVCWCVGVLVVVVCCHKIESVFVFGFEDIFCI